MPKCRTVLVYYFFSKIPQFLTQLGVLSPANTNRERDGTSPEEDPLLYRCPKQGAQPHPTTHPAQSHQPWPPNLSCPQPRWPEAFPPHTAPSPHSGPSLYLQLLCNTLFLPPLLKHSTKAPAVSLAAGGGTDWPVSCPPSIFFPLAAEKRDSAVPTACEKPPPAWCFMKEEISLGEQPNVPSLPLGVSDGSAGGCGGMAVLWGRGESGGQGCWALRKPRSHCTGGREKEVAALLGWPEPAQPLLS